MLFNSSSSAIDANLSEIAESRVPYDQPVAGAPNHTPTSRAANLLPMSSLTAGSDSNACRRKRASLDPRDSIQEPDVCNALLRTD